MGVFITWLAHNFLSVVQSLGVIGGLVFNGIAAHADAKARRMGNLFTLIDRHKQLWTELEQRSELSRILKESVKLDDQPPTTVEEVFLNRVFIYFETGWELGTTESLVSPTTMAANLRGFLKLPLPYFVWEKTKKFRNRKFVRFVQRAIQYSN